MSQLDISRVKLEDSHGKGSVPMTGSLSELNSEFVEVLLGMWAALTNPHPSFGAKYLVILRSRSDITDLSVQNTHEMGKTREEHTYWESNENSFGR